MPPRGVLYLGAKDVSCELPDPQDGRTTLRVVIGSLDDGCTMVR